MSFKGKVVIVTGASSGIGAETARHFYKEGAKLVLTGRNINNLKNVADECGGAITIQGDLVADGNFTKRIIEETLKTYAQIDVLVNNAGVLEIGTIENTSLEQFDKVFDINVRAVYQLTMFAVSHLIKTKGCIINVSSVCGLRAFPGVLSYCMSKSAIDQFTKCLALELAGNGVRVNAVNPGTIVTPLQQKVLIHEEAYKEFRETAKAAHPLGRIGQVGEVADAICFLASDKASFITGETFSIDGGRQAMCTSKYL